MQQAGGDVNTASRGGIDAASRGSLEIAISRGVDVVRRQGLMWQAGALSPV
jgi:hypothetical protein